MFDHAAFGGRAVGAPAGGKSGLDSHAPLDALPPAPLTASPTVSPAAYVYAPGDIAPRGERERELCASASHPDWLYLGGLLVADAAAVWFDSTDTVKVSGSLALRMTGPALLGLAWGATVGGAWLALPKCSPGWVDAPPREGNVREAWPLALSLAILAGATAPIVNGIAVGDLPQSWTTLERQMHLVAAGVAAFGSALLPYLLPPRTWSAAREIDRIRFAADGRGGAFLGYEATF